MIGKGKGRNKFGRRRTHWEVQFSSCKELGLIALHDELSVLRSLTGTNEFILWRLAWGTLSSDSTCKLFPPSEFESSLGCCLFKVTTTVVSFTELSKPDEWLMPSEALIASVVLSSSFATAESSQSQYHKNMSTTSIARNKNIKGKKITFNRRSRVLLTIWQSRKLYFWGSSLQFRLIITIIVPNQASQRI